MVSDGLNNIIELDLGGPRPAVVDDGLPVRPVPAVHWGENTGAQHQEAQPPRGSRQTGHVAGLRT